MALSLDDVASGKVLMSQRVKSSIDGHGGVAAAITAAKRRRVHLVQLTNEDGREIVAASVHTFETLC